jgi:hypothetical protein
LVTLSAEERAIAEEALRRARLEFSVEHTSSSFDEVRGLDTEAYAMHIVDRARVLDPLRAACGDAADALGSTDYHETTPALAAVAGQWEHVANELDVGDRLAVRVRWIAQQLRTTLADDEDYDSDHATDLISIAVQRDELLNMAATFAMAEGAGAADAWWDEHGEAFFERVGTLEWFRADLDDRDETAL